MSVFFDLVKEIQAKHGVVKIAERESETVEGKPVHLILFVEKGPSFPKKGFIIHRADYQLEGKSFGPCELSEARKLLANYESKNF